MRQKVMNGFIRYFTRWFWAYMLEKPVTLRKLVCRYRGHGGAVYSDYNGEAPSVKCFHCGDEIG